MKKSIYLLGMAVAALSSCTQNDVVEMPDNAAIKFSTFVNNNTRATEIDKAKLTQFNVFGNFGESWTKLYTNVAVTGSSETGWTPSEVAYWQKNNKYRFAAYSNGNEEISDVSYDAAAQKLTFTDYTAADKDLIAALPDEISTKEDISSQLPVSLNFAHMLSQVNFTFTNKDSRDYIMKISDLKIASAVKTATGEYQGSTVAWNGTADAEYTFADIADIADGETTDEHSCGSIFVIPQSNENLEVTFTATFQDATGAELSKKNFKASLASGDENFWKNAFRYNYTAEINGDDTSEPGDLIEIKFTVNEVADWKDATDNSVTPSEAQ